MAHLFNGLFRSRRRFFFFFPFLRARSQSLIFLPTSLVSKVFFSFGGAWWVGEGTTRNEHSSTFICDGRSDKRRYIHLCPRLPIFFSIFSGENVWMSIDGENGRATSPHFSWLAHPFSPSTVIKAHMAFVEKWFSSDNFQIWLSLAAHRDVRRRNSR